MKPPLTAPRLLVAIAMVLLTAGGARAVGLVGVEVMGIGPSTVSDITVDVPSGVSVSTVTGLLTRSIAEVTLTPDASLFVSYSFIGDSIGVYATEQSSLTFPYNGGATGNGLTEVTVFERSTGDAIALKADERARLSFRGRASVDSASNGDAIGALGLGDSSLILDGVIEATQSGNGDTFGLLLAENSQATWTGRFDLDEDGNGETFLASLSDVSEADLMGVASIRSNGNGDTFGLRLRDQTRARFVGDVSLRSSQHRDAALLDLGGESETVFDGRMVAPLDGQFNAGNRDVPSVRVSDDALLRVLGGEMAFTSARGRAEVPGGPPPREQFDVEVTDRARMMWMGGEIRAAEMGVDAMTTFLVQDESFVTIYGREFNRPAGEVPDFEGVITGVLADGSPLAITFRRDAGATILLVPEPGAVALLGSLILGGAVRWRS